MSDAFFGRLVRSENLVIKTDDLALALKKVSPDDVKGISMEEGPTKFELPGNLGNMGTGDINAKVTRQIRATLKKCCPFVYSRSVATFICFYLFWSHLAQCQNMRETALILLVIPNISSLLTGQD